MEKLTYDKEDNGDAMVRGCVMWDDKVMWKVGLVKENVKERW